MIKLEDIEKGFERKDVDISEAYGLEKGDFVITIQEPDYDTFLGLAGTFNEEGEIDTYTVLKYIKSNLKKFIISHSVEGAKMDAVVKLITSKVSVFNFVAQEILMYFKQEDEAKKKK